MALNRWGWLGACLLAFANSLAVAGDPDPTPPIDAFFMQADVESTVISPDGLHLALVMRKEFGGAARGCLLVLELRSRKLEGPAHCPKRGSIAELAWVNSRRLVYQVYSQARAEWRGSDGVFAIDRDGTHGMMLISRDLSPDDELPGPAGRILSYRYEFFCTRFGEGDDIVVLDRSFDFDGRLIENRPVLLDTRTGRVTRLVTHAPPKTTEWILDTQGIPQYAVASDQGMAILYRRDGQAWHEFARFPRVRRAGSPESFYPFGMGFDGELYVTQNGGRDTEGLYLLDAVTQRPSSTRLVEVEGFDFEGRLRRDPVARRILGVDYLSDAPGTAWTDPKMQALQGKIDAWLPDSVNQIDCQDCLSAPFLLVRAESDRQPGALFVYDRARDKLLPIGAARNAIHPDQMGRRLFTHFQARDGLDIPIYVTRPPGAKGPTAAVVLVHGGPYVRGADWRWSAEPQFLASRGYTVIEPEFRGSTGYGHKLFESGVRQWGRAMQDDIADAARWAIAQGYADAGRIAIGGASYGGYATLMGLIRDPGLFRAGFEWLGPTDLHLMFTSIRGDFSDETLRFDLPALIGDPDTQKDLLTSNSPLHRASEIHQPVLLAYGGFDRRVPSEHGIRFHDAIRRTNPDVEWVFYGEEGHGWWAEETRRDFWGRVERFLARSLSAPVH